MKLEEAYKAAESNPLLNTGIQIKGYLTENMHGSVAEHLQSTHTIPGSILKCLKVQLAKIPTWITLGNFCLFTKLSKMDQWIDRVEGTYGLTFHLATVWSHALSCPTMDYKHHYKFCSCFHYWNAVEIVFRVAFPTASTRPCAYAAQIIKL